MTSVVFDDRTNEIIEDLKKTFGVSTNAAVLRRALALAKVISDQADEKHNIFIGGKEDFVKINLTT